VLHDPDATYLVCILAELSSIMIEETLSVVDSEEKSQSAAWIPRDTFLPFAQSY
jgi:hypothetical protein